MGRLAKTLKLLEPVLVDGREVASLRLCEPRVRDFVAIGPVELVHRRGGLVVRLDLPGRLLSYLPLLLNDLDRPAIAAMLAAMSLPDAIRLKSVVSRFFFEISRQDIEAYAAVIAFDWRLMPLAETDNLGLSELAYTCRRLADHCKRRAAVAGRG